MENLKHITLTLKSGETVTIHDGDTAYLHGLSASTRISRQHLPHEIKARNYCKAKTAEIHGLDFQPEDESRPYTEAVIANTKFWDFDIDEIRDEVTDLEKYIVDCCYDSNDGKGRMYSAKNYAVLSEENPDVTPPITIISAEGGKNLRGSDLGGELAYGNLMRVDMVAHVDDEGHLEVSFEKITLFDFD